MPETPKLAVLITYHNEREMLRECLRSIADQTVAPDEVWIYDDCSEYPASDFLIPDLAVNVITGVTNQGPSVGRNRLLDECHSEYIHFHDADDMFCPEWCSKVRERIAASRPDLVLNDLSLVQDGKVIRERFYGLDGETASDFLRLAIRLTLVPSTATYRSERIRRIGAYNPRMWHSEDYDLHLRLALSGVKASAIPESLIRQRVHATNLSHDKGKCWIAGVESLGRLLPQIPAEYHAQCAEVMATFGSDLYRLGYLPEARKAFEFSARTGGATLARHGSLYRVIARWMGQEVAERIAARSSARTQQARALAKTQGAGALRN
jgi:glycosyltransferase involved in cell wall biosynthesis